MKTSRTAKYKTVFDSGGNRYIFYCGASGASVLTERQYTAQTPEQELMLAWESEGKPHFCQCQKCGRWVIDAAYNPDVLQCTDCAPFEYETRFCKICGARIDVSASERFCPHCSGKLHYEGR